MKSERHYVKHLRLKSRVIAGRFSAINSLPLALAACGGGTKEEVKGFPISYVPPKGDYTAPILVDPYAGLLNKTYEQPYWVQALEMDKYENHIPSILSTHERVIQYVLPDEQPEYDLYFVNGWQPAGDAIKIASEQVFSKLNTILDVSFVKGVEPSATNVIAIGRSSQTTTSGLSYFPNNYFDIGMDVFISKDYANPHFINDLLTNYDYEVLVHEIGHALGLKHPFEASGTNTAVLNSYEDNTFSTAMSYDEYPVTFDGALRSLDWMALTKFYGVNPTYSSGNDTYSFSSSGGVFIIDGAGMDTISVSDTSLDATIDLRSGAHSHLGNKSIYITSANQLTISHGSDIENVITGSGDDTIIGTDLDNIIVTGSGSDMIFAGGGIDTITSGAGADRIDLSENVQSRDTVTLDVASTDLAIDTIYGFEQGVLGDIFDVSEVLNFVFEFFPLVVLGSAPTANFSGGILRLTGLGVSSSTDLSSALEVGGVLETLSIDNGASAIIISADSQATGEDQSVFLTKSSNGEISVTQLAILQGNALDIDQWHAENFSFIA